MAGWVRSESAGARCSHARALERARASSPLLGATAAPAFAAIRPSPIWRTCASCASPSASPSTGCTSWVNTPKAVDSSDTADLIRAIRSQEQKHYSLLAPLLNGTRAGRRRLHVHVPGGRTPLVRPRVRLRARPRGDAARHRDRRRRRRPTIAASPSRWRRSSRATASTSPRSRCSPAPRPSRTALPRALSLEDGGNQLSQFLSN